MEAGSDTTSSTLLGFCLALIAYPHILKRAQEEVDALCPERTPTIDDLKDLPYLKACMTEVSLIFLSTPKYLNSEMKRRSSAGAP
jgi:cytochrome P450